MLSLIHISLDEVLPGEEQLRRIEAIADPYAMQPQSIMEDQESRRELYDGLKLSLIHI